MKIRRRRSKKHLNIGTSGIRAKHTRDVKDESSEVERPLLRDEVRLWLEDSEDSWKVANDNFNLGNYHVAAYYIHAAVEKTLKAAIIAFKRRLPAKTHNLKQLYSEVSGIIKLSREEEDFLGELTPTSQIARYVDVAVTLPRDIYSRNLAERYLATAKPILMKVKRTIGQSRFTE
ncbi:MAG: HEPN domain-containing protein [Candidatus Bathyarchaeia archaeon]